MRARRVFAGLAVAGLLALLTALLVPLFGRGERERTATWVWALDLNRLSVAPSGTSARDPGAARPGVPLHHVPGVPTSR